MDQECPLNRPPGQGQCGTTQDNEAHQHVQTHDAHTRSNSRPSEPWNRLDSGTHFTCSSLAVLSKRSNDGLPVFGCEFHAHPCEAGALGPTGELIGAPVESRAPARSLRFEPEPLARFECVHHVQASHVFEPDELGRATTAPVPARRRGAEGLDEGAAEASSDRDRRRRGHAPSGQGSVTASADGGEHQQGSSPQGGPPEVCEGRDGSGYHGHGDSGDPQDEGLESGVQQHSRPCGGPRGIWTVVPLEVQGGEIPATGILPAGADNLVRGPMQSTTSSPGHMAEVSGTHRDSTHAGEEGHQDEDIGLPARSSVEQPSVGIGIECTADTRAGRGGQGNASEFDGDGEEPVRRHGTGEAELEGSQAPHSSCRGRHFYERMGPSVGAAVEGPMEAYELSDGETADGPECESRELSLSEVKTLSWKAERLLPDSMEALVQTRKPILFELACAPDSVLSKQMQLITNRSSSAQRFAYWNGHDIGTNTGVRAILVAIKKQRPEHVWISTECGPFSRMQQVNQRNEKQVLELKQKRESCIRMYVGGLAIYTYCYLLGIPTTWEWSETCDAWRLPMVQRVFQRYPPVFCVTKGCRVNLKDHKQGMLLSKGWKMATTHRSLAQQMELPCQCSGKHAVCQGALTRRSAYYTTEFARRVCRAILHPQRSGDIHGELSGQHGPPKYLKEHDMECCCNEIHHPRSDMKCSMCELSHESGEVLSLVGEREEDEPDLTPEEKETALKHIAMLHRNTGHGPIEHLVRALKSRRADPRIIELARTFDCSVCQELKRHVPRPRVSLEPLAPKWHVLQSDCAFWNHPHSKVRVQFTLLIDEGCRFRIGKVMRKGPGGVSGEQMIQFYQECWKPIFGKPHKLRVDPAGPWRSHMVDDYFSREQVELDVVPAEAHWGISQVERAIQCTKHIMTKLALAEPEISPEEALAEAVRVENEREVVRGYSPAQHALGRSPDAHGRFGSEVGPIDHETLCENPEGEFQRNQERMRTAEQAFTDFVYDDRITRAKNTRSYAPQRFLPGDLVFVWRIQGLTKGPAASSRSGGYTGPCRVLAVETRMTEEGNYHPGSVVWLVRAGRLIKANVTQLRHASAREETLEAITNPNPVLPWTFTQLTTDLGNNSFDDVSGEVPEPMEIEQSRDEEQVRTFRRVRQKRSAPECPVPSREASGSNEERNPFGHMADCDIPETFQDSYAECFWGSSQAAVEIGIEVPDSKRGRLYMTNHFQSFLSAQLRRKGVEVSERHMSDDEREQMRIAKGTEVKKFLAADALKALPPHLQPSRGVAMKMRWVLTWKREESGERKAKARCVVLGYQDPCYAERQTMAPTMSRSTRQILLVVAASHGMRVAKGDVSGLPAREVIPT